MLLQRTGLGNRLLFLYSVLVVEKTLKNLHLFLHQPSRVLLICLVVGFGSLLFSNNLIRLFQLHQDKSIILKQMANIQTQISQLNSQIKMAKDPSYIERQALDLYDLIDENDLMFVFSEDE